MTVFALLLFGLAGFTAALCLAPSALWWRVTGSLIRFVGKPIDHPPAEILRAFHRGETLVVVSPQATQRPATPKLEPAS